MDTSQLFTVMEAAAAADRSEATIRRWISAGRLTRIEGPPPAAGGSAPVYVRREELHLLLVTSNAQPHSREADEAKAEAKAEAPPETRAEAVSPLLAANPSASPAQAAGTSAQAAEVAALQSRVAVLEAEARGRDAEMRLRVQLAEAQATVRIARLEGDLAAAQAELESLTRELGRLHHQLHDTQGERDNWRERHDAREAELKAFRALGGSATPWWQRLIGMRSDAPEPSAK